MGRRTSKKSKEITLPDMVQPTHLINYFNRTNDSFRNRTEDIMRRVEEFNHPRTHRLRRLFKRNKMANNREIGIPTHQLDLFDWTPSYANRPAFDPMIIARIRETMENIDLLSDFIHNKTGNCAICGFPLTEGFPEDYPDEWKFCCRCHSIANDLGNRVEANSPRYKKVYDKITLVGK